MKTEIVHRRDLKVGDRFLIKGTTRPVMFLVKEVDSKCAGYNRTIKAIPITPDADRYGLSDGTGYMHFPVLDEASAVYRVKNMRDRLSKDSLKIGDIVTPTDHPFDVMKIVDKDSEGRPCMVAISESAKYGWARDATRYRIKPLRSDQRYFLLYRPELEYKDATEVTEEPDYTGWDACITGDWVNGTDGEATIYYELSYIKGELHKMNLMSEEDYRAKHVALKFGKWAVTDEGETIKVGCREISKDSILGFLGVMKEMNLRSYTVDPGDAYNFLMDNHKKLGLSI